MKKINANRTVTAAVFAGTLVALGGCAGAGAGGASMMVLGAALSILLTLAGCSASHGPGSDDAAVDAAPDGHTPDADPPDSLVLEDRDRDGHFSDVDCDDANPEVYPGASEQCFSDCGDFSGDGLDNNCDGRIDEIEACPIANCFPMDRDLDGWAEPEDCNDDDPSIHPGAEETCCDSVDRDCDGRTEPVDLACNCFFDADGDGYGSGFGPGPDCDDTDPTIHPGADDIVCDGIDQDCDGEDNMDGMPSCKG